jgi:DNA-directed RNA polymerase sigma subunit (sigma70/sigma32)
MRQQFKSKKTIKCNRKLDATTISLIVHYLTQIGNITPTKGVTWADLANRFGYTRQTLTNHPEINAAYKVINHAAKSYHKASESMMGEGIPESETKLKQKITKLRQELQQKDEINKSLLKFLADLAQRCHERGVTLSDIPLDLSSEYRNPIFSMEAEYQNKRVPR